MNFIKNSKGITLIALVITIIVLLILAGVSLNLVMGNQGILQQATKAVDKNKAGSIQEEIQLAIAEKTIEYYKNYSEISKTYNTESDYIKEELKGGITTSSGATIKADSAGNLTYTDSNGGTTTGNVDFATGNVTIAGTTTGGNDSTKDTLSSLGISNSNIGDYIDLGNNIVGTTATTDDWRILYVEGTNVYAILADYLPNASIPAGDNITKSGYSVWSTTDRTALLDNYILDISKWSSLANGISGATVAGGATGELLINSYNTKRKSNLIYNDTDEEVMLDNTETLYVPHTEEITEDGQSTSGYWLASPNGDEYDFWRVNCDGSVSTGGYGGVCDGLRPVVRLNSEILASKTGDVWKVVK